MTIPCRGVRDTVQNGRPGSIVCVFAIYSPLLVTNWRLVTNFRHNLPYLRNNLVRGVQPRPRHGY